MAFESGQASPDEHGVPSRNRRRGGRRSRGRQDPRGPDVGNPDAPDSGEPVSEDPAAGGLDSVAPDVGPSAAGQGDAGPSAAGESGAGETGVEPEHDGEGRAARRTAGRHSSGHHGRAGRDLRAASLVGISLMALLAASLFLWMPAFVGIVLVAAVLAVSELSQALNTRGVAVPLVPVLIGTVLMCVGAYVGGAGPLVATFGLTIVAVGVWRLGDAAPGYLRDVSAGIFTTVYVPLLAGFVLLLAASEHGAWAVVALLAVVVASDTGGYFAGVLIGRHPMAPSVSPKKSWEGFAGSLVLGSAVGVGVMTFGFDGQWWMGLVLGAVGVVSATVGDLGESLLKRDLGIKDMSDLLPGHGGLMDRVDSILPTAPLVWLVLTLTVGL